MISAVYNAESQNSGDHFLNMGVEMEPEGQIGPDSTIKFTFDGEFVSQAIMGHIQDIQKKKKKRMC